MTDLNASQGQQLRRVLKPRHLNMIAIGGSIGTGLFVASGATVATAGPAVRCFLRTDRADGVLPHDQSRRDGGLHARFRLVLHLWQPVRRRWLRFRPRWNYWYNWAVTIAAELVAAQLVMSFWFPEVPGIYWSAIFLGIMFGLNVISARASARANSGSP